MRMTQQACSSGIDGQRFVRSNGLATVYRLAAFGSSRPIQISARSVSQPLREAFKLKREMNAVCGGISRYSANVTLLEVGMRLEGAASVLMARVGLRRSEYLSPAEREFSHRRRSTLGFYRHIIETN